MSWKTMDTAPKDGTIILAWYPIFWKKGGDFTDPNRVDAFTTIRWDYDNLDEVGDWYLLDGTTAGVPRYWMHLDELPPLPKEAK